MRIIAYTYRCSGCHICEQACAFQHFGVQNFLKARLRVATIVEKDRAVYHKVTVCRQCNDPPCVKACPTGAIVREKTGIRLDESKCNGCMNCVEACPYNAIFVHPELSIPLFCDLCYPGEPVCVNVCPMGALEVKS
ncbi:MAG: 4Fe-4S dicluster domain-containing protein [Thermoproteales archaeon]|nr:4Fe-4S dicluster domain-containing protein [Thermoproteales archaeon]RLE66040.1 MAG: hypothetical protein DRJ47_03490 [Thermoprotei archaeon]